MTNSSEPGTTSKLAYYSPGTMRKPLAMRYIRQFGDVRKVLDVGCGTGDFGRFWPSGVEIDGIDVDPGAIEVASHFEKALCFDLESKPLPYEDNSFDAVLAKDILEHLQDPSRLVREIYRVLRPDGILIASVIMAKSRAVWSDYTHVRGFTAKSSKLMLEDVGFKVEAVWRMGGVPLTSRLRLMWLVPTILRLPIIGYFYASSWELRAIK